MGVKGLTSFINQKEELYFEDFQLKDCYLVIDGLSLASCLYNSAKKMNSCFGGDYDKYANVIRNFFGILCSCNVTPIVICDGGIERKKLNTCKRRMVNRMFSFKKIVPSYSPQICFPLMMRHVFRETILDLKHLLLQSDFEADNEIAALARKLNAPVLSNDSDFYIFDVEYIPLSSMSFDTHEKDLQGNCYIQCKKFHLNHLLNDLGLSVTMMPFLATLLGNDYINASDFKQFYSHLKMDKRSSIKPGQKRIKSLVSWLKNEDFESALQKILLSVKKRLRKIVKKNIKTVIKGYTNLSTPLDLYLPKNITVVCENNSVKLLEQIKDLSKNMQNVDIRSDSDDDNSDQLDDGVNETESTNSNQSDDDISESDFDDTEPDENNIDDSILSGDEDNIPLATNKKCAELPSWYLHESRKGNICPHLNTLLSLGIYFFEPQVEDYNLPHAGIVTLPILQVISGLLNFEIVKYWARNKNHYECSHITIEEHNFPNFNNIFNLSELKRQDIIFDALKIENKLLISNFPEDWKLFLMCISYWEWASSNTPIKPCHVHALVMSLIAVNVIPSKIGKYWQKNTFMKKYGSKLRILKKKKGLKVFKSQFSTVMDAINAVKENDCILAMDFLMPYFHLATDLYRLPNQFSRSTVHIYAQLQCTFQMATTLNSLLLLPFYRSNLSMFVNSTFLYNFTANFKGRSNILLYVEHLFSNIPSILNLYLTIYDKLCQFIPNCPKNKVRIKKHKIKESSASSFENNVTETEEKNVSEDLSESESFVDKNNKYTLLGKN